MAIDYDVPKDKRLLYWLGDKLIDYRHPVSIVVAIRTLVPSLSYVPLQSSP